MGEIRKGGAGWSKRDRGRVRVGKQVSVSIE